MVYFAPTSGLAAAPNVYTAMPMAHTTMQFPVHPHITGMPVSNQKREENSKLECCVKILECMDSKNV